MADDFKYHIDHHSALVPPPDLLAARAAFQAGALTPAELRAATDAAVTDAVRRQRRLCLLALSDGEFRRAHHLSVVYDAVEGFGSPAGAPTALARLVGPGAAPQVRPLAGPPVSQGRLAEHEAAAVLAVADRSTMLALPAPGFVAELCAAPSSRDTDAQALAQIIRSEIGALAQSGVRHVLLRNPAYAFLLNEAGREHATALGLDPDLLAGRMLDTDRQVLDGLQVPDEFRVSLDLTTAGAVNGPWAHDAVARFLAAQPFGRLCVEYPAGSAHRFPLETVPPGVVVSLGLVAVDGPLETVDDMVRRVDEAAAVIKIDDLAISTNGAFTWARRQPTADEQKDRLQRVEMVARYFWGLEL